MFEKKTSGERHLIRLEDGSDLHSRRQDWFLTSKVQGRAALITLLGATAIEVAFPGSFIGRGVYACVAGYILQAFATEHIGYNFFKNILTVLSPNALLAIDRTGRNGLDKQSTQNMAYNFKNMARIQFGAALVLEAVLMGFGVPLSVHLPALAYMAARGLWYAQAAHKLETRQWSLVNAPAQSNTQTARHSLMEMAFGHRRTAANITP